MVNTFDPSQYVRTLYEATVPPMPELEAEKIELWQQGLRQTIVGLLGGFPQAAGDLLVREDEPEERGWYRSQKVVFRSRPGMDVPGYFLTPSSGKPSGATIVCIHGHGPGVTSLIGLEPDGRPRKQFTGLHKDYALMSVKHGHNALAIEQACFGTRRDELAKSAGPEESCCQPIAGAALLLGQTVLGWRVYDVIRALDYLCGRPDVNPSRIGCMGLSAGGTTTLFAAALDVRVKAAVVSGYFNTFLDSIMAVPHCICNYVPGMLSHAEMYHLAGLVAPRALFIESATRDLIYPAEGTKRAYAQAKRIFDALGAGHQIALEVFDGDHEFSGRSCFEFLADKL